MAEITIVRHPKYKDSPHFYVEYGSYDIIRLDKGGPLTLLKNEHNLTTYTFQMPRTGLASEHGYPDGLYRIELETQGEYGQSIKKNIYSYHDDYRKFTGLNDIWFVDSTGARDPIPISYTVGIDGGKTTYTTPSTNDYDTMCFSYTFHSDHTCKFDSDKRKFCIHFYQSSSKVSSTHFYLLEGKELPITISFSQNLLDNPHAKVVTAYPPESEGSTHFYIEPSTNYIFCTNRRGLIFTSMTTPTVVFQMPRIWNGNDFYNLSTLVIKAKLGDTPIDDVIIKSADGIDNVFYVSSVDNTKNVTNPDTSPDPTVYDMICFKWDIWKYITDPGLASFSVEGVMKGVTKISTTDYTDVEHRTQIVIENGKVYHPDYPAAPHFSIDPVSRALRLMSEDVITLTSKDSGGARVTFQMPRMLDDSKDLYDSTAIRVYYANTSATDSQDKNTGAYTCKLLSSTNTLSSFGINDIVYINSVTGEVFRVRYDSNTKKYTRPPADFDVMCFSWVISEAATAKAGYLAFAVQFAKNTPEKYVWNSGMYTDISVGESLSLGEAYEETISDILEVFYEQFEIATVNTVDYVAKIIEQANADITKMVTAHKDEVNDLMEQTDIELKAAQSFAVSDTQPEDPRIAVWINPSDTAQQIETFLEPTDVVQYFGDNEKAIISQKAVSERFDAVDSKLEKLESDFAVPTSEAVGKYLETHPKLTTTVMDNSIGEAKLTDELKLKTIHNYVTPQMFGAVCDGVTNDGEALQRACETGMPVVIDKDIAIDQTIYVSNSVTINEGVTVTILANVDGFKMGTIDDRTVEIDGETTTIRYRNSNQSINGSGTIKVLLEDYSKSIIVIDGGRYVKVSDVTLSASHYYDRAGIGISISSDSQNSAYCRIINANIIGFRYGIHIYRSEGSKYWNNNHEIISHTSFCANSVRVERSNHNRIKVYGESGVHPCYNIVDDAWKDISEYSDDSIYIENNQGTELYVVDSDLNWFDVNLVDTGNEDHNQYSIHFVGGNDNVVYGSVYAHRVKGSCKLMGVEETATTLPIPGVYDLFANLKYVRPDDYANEGYTVESVNEATLKAYKNVFTYPKITAKPQDGILRYAVGGGAGTYATAEQGCLVTLGTTGIGTVLFKFTGSACPRTIEMSIGLETTIDEGSIIEYGDFVQVNMDSRGAVCLTDYFSFDDVTNMKTLRIRLLGATSLNGAGSSTEVLCHYIAGISVPHYSNRHKEYVGIYRRGDIMAGDLRFAPGSGPTIVSPSGKKFRLTVSDDGVLTAVDLNKTYNAEAGGEDYR